MGGAQKRRGHLRSATPAARAPIFRRLRPRTPRAVFPERVVTRFIKLPMPGGKVVYLNEASYAKFCGNVQELVKCMERAEYVGVLPEGTVLAMNHPTDEWPK